MTLNCILKATLLSNYRINRSQSDSFLKDSEQTALKSNKARWCKARFQPSDWTSRFVPSAGLCNSVVVTWCILSNQAEVEIMLNKPKGKPPLYGLLCNNLSTLQKQQYQHKVHLAKFHLVTQQELPSVTVAKRKNSSYSLKSSINYSKGNRKSFQKENQKIET